MTYRLDPPKFSERTIWVSRAIALLMFSIGSSGVLRTLLYHLPVRRPSWLPYTVIPLLGSSLNLLLGVTLMYIAIHLLWRKLLAWWLAVGSILILIIINYEPSAHVHRLVVLVAALTLLLATKAYFQVRYEPVRVKQGVMIFLISIGLALGYGTLGFWLLDKPDFGSNFGLGESLVRTIRAYLLIGNPDLHPISRHADWFLDSLGLMGSASALYGLFMLFRPLAYAYTELPIERAKVERILQTYSTDTEDYFKIWPHDKSYVFSDDGKSVIAYGVEAGVAFSIGDPVGAAGSLPNVLRKFQQLCLSNGWIDCYMIYVNESNRRLYEDAGCTFFKIGEDAVISTSDFAATTARGKHFRNIANRFTGAGYTAELVRPPHQAKDLSGVAAVSADWLRQPGHREWHFFTGRYTPAYMTHSPLFVVRDEAGAIQAFANLIPVYQEGWATIDLMRYRTSAPNNIMDFLLLQLITELHDEGVKFFNLGLAPMSGLQTGARGGHEKLLNLLYRSNQTYFSAQGLRRFKHKFNPEWSPRYMAYRGPAGNLPKIAYAFSKLIYRK